VFLVFGRFHNLSVTDQPRRRYGIARDFWSPPPSCVQIKSSPGTCEPCHRHARCRAVPRATAVNVGLCIAAPADQLHHDAATSRGQPFPSCGCGTLQTRPTVVAPVVALGSAVSLGRSRIPSVRLVPHAPASHGAFVARAHVGAEGRDASCGRTTRRGRSGEVAGGRRVCVRDAEVVSSNLGSPIQQRVPSSPGLAVRYNALCPLEGMSEPRDLSEPGRSCRGTARRC
jgi:hypothetical protein